MDFGAKILTVVHGAAAVVLIGSTTHNGIMAVRQLWGRPIRPNLQKTYVSVLGWAFVVTFCLGLLSYPEFRLGVRAAYLDEAVPTGTVFFEIKEHWIGIGLVLLLGYWPMSRTIDIRERTVDTMLYHVLGVVMVPIVWMAMWTGLIVTVIKPVGG